MLAGVSGEESESQLSPEPPGSDEVRLSQPATGGAPAWAVSERPAEGASGTWAGLQFMIIGPFRC